MKLPNRDQAVVPPEKVTDYLLNTAHEDGRGKALFFLHFGFSMAHWEVLAQALVRHARDHEVANSETSDFGTRYVVEGVLETPSQRTVKLRVVWFISAGESRYQTGTAYPLEE